MKKMFLGIIFAAYSSSALSAENPDFMNFVLKNAHENGIASCDAKIRTAFSGVGGADVWVNSSWFTETRGESLKLTAVYGHPKDSIYTEVVITEGKSDCLIYQTSQLTLPKSCASYMSEVSDSFKYDGETLDRVTMKNAGGVNLYVQDINGSCLATYQITR